MFPGFRKKPFLTDAENKKIVEAIKSMEQSTSGEIRVYLESRNPLVSTFERATEIFFRLKMENTKHRNAVLLYVAVKDREVALFGDEGIHRLVGAEFWKSEVDLMIKEFRENHLCEGIVQCIIQTGKTLSEKFPYSHAEDKNELPDEIVFGR